MRVKKKHIVTHSRFVLRSPFLDKTKEKLDSTNKQLAFYSKKTLAVLIAITTMATPIMANPVYAKSTTSSSTAGDTSTDSDKDVESSSSAEIDDEAGEEPEPYQCSGDVVDYENTELLTDGDGAGEITCAQSNGVYYKLTNGNKASSYHWIAWYRDKSKDEADIEDDDGNYTGFSSSKVSAWQPYQSEIEELNDGAFPESKTYSYPTDTTTGTLDFWADIAGNYTVLGDPKYDSLELTAYEQVVYARTEEVEEPYEIPSDEDVSADDAGGLAGGSGGGTSTDGDGKTGDTGNGEENTGWSKYRYCNNQTRKDVNELLNSLGYKNTKNNDTDKNGIEAESDLKEDYEKLRKKIYSIINDNTEEKNKLHKSDYLKKYYKIHKVYKALYDKQTEFVRDHQILSLGQDDGGPQGWSKRAYSFWRGITNDSNKITDHAINSWIKNAIKEGKLDSSFTNFDVSKITDANSSELFCTVTKRTSFGTYTKADGSTVNVKIVKRHDNMGNTSYSKYAQAESGKWKLISKSNVDSKLEVFNDYSGDSSKETKRKSIKSILFGSSDEGDTLMSEEFTENANDSLTEKAINKALSKDESDNEIIGTPYYEAGEAAYSEDAGYTVIKSTTTTYYYMNIEIAKATIDNIYATEIAQLDNLGLVKGSGNDVQAKISKDTDGFWGSVTPSYWGNNGTITISNDSSTIYHFDKVDSRNNYGYTDDDYTVDLYSLLNDHDKISKFIHGYNNIKDSKISSTSYPSTVEENCITTKSSTGKSSQVCSKAQTPLMKQTLVINEDSKDQEELDDEQVETNVTLTKDNDKEQADS